MCVPMEKELKSYKDKPLQNNGFTMLEVLFVLFILSVLMISLTKKPLNVSSIFSKSIQMHCINAQEQAFIDKETVQVVFKENEAYFGTERYIYPKGFVCQPESFHYNYNGNISKGGHVDCYNGKKIIRFVFQIGTGRVRVQ